jgi:hypothetical protein
VVQEYFSIIWTEDNTNGCSDRDTVFVRFLHLDTITQTDVLNMFGPYIIDQSPITLSAELAGGTWSGPGITNSEFGIFDPSIAGMGTHYVTCAFSQTDCFGTLTFRIIVTGLNFSGHIYRDLDSDCTYDDGEGIPNKILCVNPGPYYFHTDSTGKFRGYLDEGAYTLHTSLLENCSFSCPETGFANFSITNINDTLNDINLGMQSSADCAVLNVNTILFGLRPCTLSLVSVLYSNSGTALAEDAYIIVELDSNLSPIECEMPFSVVDENTIRFDVGDIDVFETGSFYFKVLTDCDESLLGNTKCVITEILPNGNCEIEYGMWDFSEIAIEGDCDFDQNVCFILNNCGESGVGDMLFNREFRIFANDTLVYTGTFKLEGGESVEICWAANGSAIRLEADQHPDYPYGGYATNTVEGCGDANGTSYGYITTNTYGDEAHYTDIDCQIITGSLRSKQQRSSAIGYY